MVDMRDNFFKLNKDQNKRLKKLMSNFQNRRDPKMQDGYEEGNNPLSETGESMTEPIYFDELSLVKFIEDYLENQL